MLAGKRVGLAEVGGPCLTGWSVPGLDGFSASRLEWRCSEVVCMLLAPPAWFSAIFWAISTGVGMDPGGWYNEGLLVPPKLPLGRGELYSKDMLSM